MLSGECKRTATTEHSIFIKLGARLAHQIPYSQVPMRSLTQIYVDEQLRVGVNEPTNCEWETRVVFPSDQHRNLTLIVDYMWLNLATIADSYSLPLLDYCTDSF